MEYAIKGCNGEYTSLREITETTLDDIRKMSQTTRNESIAWFAVDMPAIELETEEVK